MSQPSQNRTKSIILIVVHLFFILLFVALIIFVKRPAVCTKCNTPKKLTTEEVSGLLKPGTVGEISQNGGGVSPEIEIASYVRDTSGVIQEIKEDRIVVQGDGFNFADQAPRLLTVIFTEDTITQKPGGANKQVGLEGLKQLKSGMEILISAIENIRGKTEFKADIITIL